MKIVVALALVLSLSACATTESVVPIPVKPSSAQAVAGAESIRVTVTANDARATNRGRISTKINGYGMEMAAIRLQGDVADTVKAALSDEIKARGYQISAGGVTVNAAVETFYNAFGVGIFAGKANSTVDLTVTVTGADGRQTYSHKVTGLAHRSVQLASGTNAAATLSDALAVAISNLFADPTFVQALKG